MRISLATCGLALTALACMPYSPARIQVAGTGGHALSPGARSTLLDRFEAVCKSEGLVAHHHFGTIRRDPPTPFGDETIVASCVTDSPTEFIEVRAITRPDTEGLFIQVIEPDLPWRTEKASRFERRFSEE